MDPEKDSNIMEYTLVICLIIIIITGIVVLFNSKKDLNKTIGIVKTEQPLP